MPKEKHQKSSLSEDEEREHSSDTLAKPSFRLVRENDKERKKDRRKEKDGREKEKREREKLRELDLYRSEKDAEKEREREKAKRKRREEAEERENLERGRDRERQREKERERNRRREKERQKEKERERKEKFMREREEEERDQERKRRKRETEEEELVRERGSEVEQIEEVDNEDGVSEEQKRLDEEMEKRRRRVQEWQERKRKEEEEKEKKENEMAEKVGNLEELKEDREKKAWTLDGDDSDDEEKLVAENEEVDEGGGEETGKDGAGIETPTPKNEGENGKEEEVDPLDAFMNSIVAPEVVQNAEVGREAGKITDVKKAEAEEMEGMVQLGNGAPPLNLQKKTEIVLGGNKKVKGGFMFNIPLRVPNGSKKKKKKAAGDAGQNKKSSSLGRIYDSGSDGDDEDEEDEKDVDEEGKMTKNDEEENDAEFLKRMSDRGSKIDKLPPVDHSKIEYPPFRKMFYKEVKEVSRMSDAEVAAYRSSFEFKLRGKDIPKPVLTWHHTGLTNKVLEVIKKQGWERPMPIQSQALPIIMSGRDCIGIAKTGSGKTMAFVLPMLRHIKDQPDLEPGDGPIALILAPTRELVQQIHSDIKKFARSLDLSAVPVYGGGGVAAQISELKRGAHIVVCTPGRMIDILCTGTGKITNLRRVTYLVMDEADRMFDMGFEPQITRMVQNTRPDRQTVLFSATFPRQVEALARKVLTRPVEIQVGGRSVVNKDITQTVEVRPEGDERFLRLLELLGEWYERGKILVFVHSQDKCDMLFRELMGKGYPCLSLHGGKDQTDRESTLSDFKANVCNLMVATSVAARGLDVKDLELVVNYDVPNHYEDYVHRVGRTGRAGKSGHAVTFISPEEERFAPDLVRALELSGQPVPEDLKKMADDFNGKVKAGEVQAHGSGYGGSGFKFNEEEEEGRKALKKAQAKEYGVEGDSESESESEGIRKVEGSSSSSNAAAAAAAQTGASQIAVAQAAALAAAARAGIQPAAHPPVLTVGSQPPAVQTAQQAIQEMIRQKLIAAGAGNILEPPTAAQPFISPGLTPGIGGVLGSEGAQKAAAFAAALNLQHNMQKLQQEVVVPEHYEAEMEINDFPQHARWKVTHKDSLGQINEWTGAAITTRGQYYPPGKHPPAGEKRLYLFIEGPTAESVKKAKIEIKRILEDASASSMSSNVQQPGKYTL